ncbi:Hypothetical predicted protein [Scomber scombrus]|uniref:Uncharacterized protein n=1 Tax=Scomber scombrus TaxID=13677 RepID=A0AAV1Q6S7_SCOSC
MNHESFHVLEKYIISKSNLSVCSPDFLEIILTVPVDCPDQQSTAPPAPAPHHSFAQNQNQKPLDPKKKTSSMNLQSSYSPCHRLDEPPATAAAALSSYMFTLPAVSTM